MKTTTKLWIGIGALALASPFGLLLPEKFKAGSAWGEWGAGEIANTGRLYPAWAAKALRPLERPLRRLWTFQSCTAIRTPPMPFRRVRECVLCCCGALAVGKFLFRKRRYVAEKK